MQSMLLHGLRECNEVIVSEIIMDLFLYGRIRPEKREYSNEIQLEPMNSLRIMMCVSYCVHILTLKSPTLYSLLPSSVVR